MPPVLLLADDSVTIQRVIELTFADEDIRVVTVGDGDQAIATIEREPPDIYLEELDRAFAGRGHSKDAAQVLRKDQPSPREVPATLAGPPSAPPSLAEAFAAVLAAEQAGVAPPALIAAPELTEEAIDRSVQRVIERLAKGGSITEVVTQVAERLVREEIERIRATSGVRAHQGHLGGQVLN
jgi:CheY-like chemotaxis protein